MRHAFVCGYSRSGTTLLATILDSHPEISMGYELMPDPLPPLPEAVEYLKRAARSEDGAPPDEVLRRDPATRSLGLFALHANWALVDNQELTALLSSWAQQGRTETDSLRSRVGLAMAVVELKREKEETTLTGFKVQTSHFESFNRMFPGSGFVAIVRDPRDVVASQLGRGFDRSVERIAGHWRKYYQRFRLFSMLHPGRTVTVRYEDLVRDPEPHYARIFGMLGLRYGDEVRHYWESKASVHRTHHNNAPMVKLDLYTSKVGRWKQDLDAGQVSAIERICRRPMIRLGYTPEG
jgi:hypothetical protein